MAKNKKSVNIQKKKGNAVAVGDSTNGKFKNKSGGLNKKQKNKKIKKAGGDNSPVKSTILTEKDVTIVDLNVSNGQETNNSSPKKAKKGKKVVVAEAVAGEILSNPKVAKKKSKKKKVKTVIEPVSPTKANKKKNAAQVEEEEEENVVQERPPKSDKKRTNSTAEDEENEVEMDPASGTTEDEDDEVEMERASGTSEDEDDEIEMEQASVTSEDEDDESDVSLKKQKSKKAKADDETTAEAEKGEFESFESITTNSIRFSLSNPDKTPSVSVFVGNLPVNTKRGKILKLFSKFGKVKSIRFRLSNGNKFFKSQSKVTAPNVIAFVDYESVDDATASLVLNGEKLKDNVLRVNLQSKAKSADSFDGKRTVFVGNLKYCKYASHFV